MIIHRAIYGSVERFMAILIEHFEGDFPLWLSHVQAKIIPVSDSHADYAFEVKSRLESAGLWVDVDCRVEKMGLKIREAEKQRIPYMLVIGDKEAANQSLALRKRKSGNLGEWSVQETIERFHEEMKGEQ